jgi:hypothetical protein
LLLVHPLIEYSLIYHLLAINDYFIADLPFIAYVCIFIAAEATKH